jgi:hypothetical protein
MGVPTAYQLLPHREHSLLLLVVSLTFCALLPVVAAGT